MQVVVHVDGGARGNPGPAAAAAVVSAPDGRVLDEAAVTLGRATNNVAEYRGLLLGLERAAALGASEVEVVNDSELIARQVDGSYKVKNADLRSLHEQAKAALNRFDRWSIRSVPRAQNAAADALVNRALDGEELVAGPPAPETAHTGDDELLPSVVQQACEPWLELILHDMVAARDALADGRPDAAAPPLRRAVAVERLLDDQLVALEAIEPEESLREALERVSQSRRLRGIESLSGSGDRPAGPSLYESFRTGLELPEAREQRLAELARLFRDHAGDPRHEVAQLLLAHDEALARWRRRLGSGADRRRFPELWDAHPQR